MSEKSLASELYSAAAIMSMLPENPGYNGSVLLIDDEEASRISSILTRAAETLSSPPHVADALDGERYRVLRDHLRQEYNSEKGFIRWYLSRSGSGFTSLDDHLDSIIAARAEAGGNDGRG